VAVALKATAGRHAAFKLVHREMLGPPLRTRGALKRV